MLLDKNSFGALKGRLVPELQLSIDPPILIAPAKVCTRAECNVWKNLCRCFRNQLYFRGFLNQMTFDHLFLVKFTASNVIFSMFYSACWWLLESTCNSIKRFLCKLWLLGCIANSDLQTLSHFLSLVFFSFSYWFAVENGEKIGFPYFFVMKFIEHFLSRLQDCDKTHRFAIVLVTIVCLVMVENIFVRSNCTLSKCRLIITH